MGFSSNDTPDLLLAELRRHNLLLPLVRARLVADTVGAIALSPEQQEQARQQQRTRHRLDDAAAEAAHLAEQGLAEADWIWQAELPLKVRLCALEHFRPKAESRFLESKDRLDQVVYSLLRLQDAYLAQELYLRISGGEADFAELAQAHSQGPEKDRRGVVGPVPLIQAHPALAERLRRSSPGSLLEPFRIDQWWLVARLESLNPAMFDDATAERISLELFEEWVRRESVDTMAGLLRQSPDPALQ